jgi:cell division protein FtsX
MMPRKMLDFFLIDITGLKAVLLIWGPALSMIVLSQKLNAMDPDFNWMDQDPLYWGDIALLIAFLMIIGALIFFAIRSWVRSKRAERKLTYTLKNKK